MKDSEIQKRLEELGLTEVSGINHTFTGFIKDTKILVLIQIIENNDTVLLNYFGARTDSREFSNIESVFTHLKKLIDSDKKANVGVDDDRFTYYMNTGEGEIYSFYDDKIIIIENSDVRKVIINSKKTYYTRLVTPAIIKKILEAGSFKEAVEIIETMMMVY